MVHYKIVGIINTQNPRPKASFAILLPPPLTTALVFPPFLNRKTTLFRTGDFSESAVAITIVVTKININEIGSVEAKLRRESPMFPFNARCRWHYDG